MLTVLFSCKKKDVVLPSPPPPPFKASFNIYERFYGTAFALPTDTIVNYQAFIEAAGDYDSYRWTVGNDPTEFKAKAFRLQFPLEESGNTIDVTLVATKKGEADTVRKHFVVMALKGTSTETLTSYTVQLNYLGRFEGGYEDQPTRKFVVTLANIPEKLAPGGGFHGFRIFNLPEGCGARYVAGQPCVMDTISPRYYSYGFDNSYRAFYLNDGYEIGCCPPVEMFGYLDNKNADRLIVECNFKNGSSIIKRKFIGNRL